MIRFHHVVPCLAVAACADPAVDPTLEWSRFNGEDDVVTVEVVAADAVGEAVTVELRSTSGASRVGEATIDPGSGPVGTVHTVLVAIDEAYAERVRRAEVQTATESRGTWTIPLEQDSAEAGLWIRELVSLGASGEERTDTFAFQLFELVEPTPEPDPAEE